MRCHIGYSYAIGLLLMLACAQLGWCIEGLPATAAAEHNRVLRVGPLRSLRTVSAAAAVAANGDTVEIDAGDYIADVAVWKQDWLTLRGVGGTVRLMAGGASAQGKAIWVIAGGHVSVENITFADARVPDRNGAGIRLEQGQLTVRNCTFLNNENGILTAGDSQSELVIEDSEFGHNGAGDGYSHNLYVGSIKKLTVTGSYFHHAKIGHLVKSRAAENHIFYNRLTDETGGTASYELEFPNGGLAFVVGNIIQQAPTTQNLTVIAYGMEGYKWPRNELYLAYNTIVDDAPKNGIFLNYKPGLDILRAGNNVLVGKDTPARSGAISINNNLATDGSSFAQASLYDYRPRGNEITEFKVSPMAPAHGVSLVPTREYVYPVGTRALAPGHLLPGALQGR